MIGKLRLLCGMLLVAALALAIAGAVVGDSSDQVTEIAIDGDSADWSTMGTTSWDRRGDGRGGIDILSVRAFTSDAYLFVLIELAPGIGDYSFVSLAINPSGDEEAPFYANANPREKTTLDLHRFANGEFTPIGEHGEAAEGEDAIEILVPLAVLGTVVERFEVEIVAGSSPNIFLADGAIVAYLAHVEGVESGEHTAAAPEITSSASDDASPEVAGEPSSALAEIYDCGQAVATDLSATEGELTWARLGGPPAGLGYDIRMDPQNPDKMYVTDAFAGLHISTAGGRSWVP